MLSGGLRAHALLVSIRRTHAFRHGTCHRSRAAPPQDVEECQTLDMAQHCPGIKRTRVLLVHGEKDARVPLEAPRTYEKLVPGARVRLIPDGDHNFEQPGPAKEMIAAVVEFFAAEPV